MLVVPELEREIELLWELRDTRKVFIELNYIFHFSDLTEV
jgi:hypothetical protein